MRFFLSSLLRPRLKGLVSTLLALSLPSQVWDAVFAMLLQAGRWGLALLEQWIEVH